MAPTTKSFVDTADGRANDILNDPRIRSFLQKNNAVEPRARQAAEWLIGEHKDEATEKLVAALERSLPSLLAGTVRVFFSYKSQDRDIAVSIAHKLQRWSAGKLIIDHMADFAVNVVGRSWRDAIEKSIPQCDWFLLLLPSGDSQRDWTLFEAGYFFRGQGLSGHLVCLHHPDNEIADALGDQQSVPADLKSVRSFLEGLFLKPNWIPGMLPLNEYLDDLDGKASEIVALIKPPAAGPAVKACCGPHMEVAFEDASAVRAWDQLAAGIVLHSNVECLHLFGLEVPKRLLGEWFAGVAGAERNTTWVSQLAEAIRAAGNGLVVPAIHDTLIVGDAQNVCLKVCAVSRRRSDNKVESLDLVFTEAEPPPPTLTMKPELAALSMTLLFAVKFRYQFLEPYANRVLEAKDVIACNRIMNQLGRDLLHDPRFRDPIVIRQRVLASFADADREVIKRMYDRSDELWRPDGEGLMDRAVAELDTLKVAAYISELLKMSQDFLTVTSKRFADIVAGN